MVPTITTSLIQQKRTHTWNALILDMEIGIIQAVNIQYNSEDRQQDHVGKKKNEKLHIAKTNAVIDPGAVVIHSNNAAVTLTAVMSSWWLIGVALGTKEHSFLFG